MRNNVAHWIVVSVVAVGLALFKILKGLNRVLSMRLRQTVARLIGISEYGIDVSEFPPDSTTTNCSVRIAR